MRITSSVVSAEKVSQENSVKPTWMTVPQCLVSMVDHAVMKLVTSVVNALLDGLAHVVKVILELARTCLARTVPIVSTSSKTSSACKSL